MENNAIFQRMTDLALSLGAFRASVIPVESIETDAAFRDMCAANVCGNYGRNWKCPPDAGDIHELIAELRTYRGMAGQLGHGLGGDGGADPPGGRFQRKNQSARWRA